MKDNTRSCVNRIPKIQMNSLGAHFGPATAHNSSSLCPNLSLTSTSLESKYPLSSASVSLETILVVFPGHNFRISLHITMTSCSRGYGCGSRILRSKRNVSGKVELNSIDGHNFRI